MVPMESWGADMGRLDLILGCYYGQSLSHALEPYEDTCLGLDSGVLSHGELGICFSCGQSWL